MWERCKAPTNLAEKKIVLAIRANPNFKVFTGVKFVGYTRGCDAIVIAFDEFVGQKTTAVKTKKPSSMPLQPPGSLSEDPSSTDSEEPDDLQEIAVSSKDLLAQTLNHYLECAKRGESLEGMMEKLQELSEAIPKKLPTVYTWEKAKELLKKERWNEGPLEWWTSDIVEPKPPRLQLRTRFEVEPEETGVQALDKAGIVELKLPLELQTWSKQPALVRRFWRAVLGFFSQLNRGMTMPAEEMCKIFDYANTYLPAFWKFKRRKLVFIRDSSDKMPLCDPDFFIRMFDFAVTIRRHGIEKIWDVEEFGLPVSNTLAKVRNFISVRYPWVELPEKKQMLIDCCLDQACEFLWLGSTGKECKNLPTFKFDSNLAKRVAVDCVQVCSWSKQLELYNADNFGSAPRFEERFSDTLLDSRSIWYEAKPHTHWIHEEPVASGPVSLGFGRLCNSKTRKLRENRNNPEIVRVVHKNKLIERELLDLNWTICTKHYSNYAMVFPEWLLLMQMRVPLLPMAVTKRVTERLLYSVLIQDDDLWLSQRSWSARMPLFKIDKDKLYINTGYAAFSRAMLCHKIKSLLK